MIGASPKATRRSPLMNNQKCMKSLQTSKCYSVKQAKRREDTQKLSSTAKENKRLVNALSDELVPLRVFSPFSRRLAWKEFFRVPLSRGKLDV
jgi:hypothetical protein